MELNPLVVSDLPRKQVIARIARRKISRQDYYHRLYALMDSLKSVGYPPFL